VTGPTRGRPSASRHPERAEGQDLVDALRRLAQDIEAPPINPQAERALLEAFDRARALQEAPARRRLLRPRDAAALLALAATLALVVVSRSGRAPASPAIAPLTTTEFVIWPGAAELPRFESGHLMRMELPVSALPSLGLVPPSSREVTVHADVLVGQDGFPRAVRLSPDF
jgi:hypothetical protein